MLRLSMPMRKIGNELNLSVLPTRAFFLNVRVLCFLNDGGPGWEILPICQCGALLRQMSQTGLVIRLSFGLKRGVNLRGPHHSRNKPQSNRPCNRVDIARWWANGEGMEPGEGNLPGLKLDASP